MVDDDLLWKITFGGRQSSVEDDLWWKTTFIRRQTLLEDTLRCKTPLLEDGLHSVEDDLGGRRPSVGLAEQRHTLIF